MQIGSSSNRNSQILRFGLRAAGIGFLALAVAPPAMSQGEAPLTTSANVESEQPALEAPPTAPDERPDEEPRQSVPEEIDSLYDELYDEDLDDAFDEADVAYPDPIESTNRVVFAFNRQVDKWLLDPLTEAYQFVVPKPARHAISRIFLNLSSTKTLVNDLLQLEWKDAGVTTSRLLINTTVGLVGIFDVAQEFGLEAHESDFGQTLALAGTPSGPYIVLPILGPANVRDGIGTVVDGFFQADLLHPGSRGTSDRPDRNPSLQWKFRPEYA